MQWLLAVGRNLGCLFSYFLEERESLLNRCLVFLYCLSVRLLNWSEAVNPSLKVGGTGHNRHGFIHLFIGLLARDLLFPCWFLSAHSHPGTVFVGSNFHSVT